MTQGKTRFKCPVAAHYVGIFNRQSSRCQGTSVASFSLANNKMINLSSRNPGNALVPLFDQVGGCLKSSALLVGFNPTDGEITCVAPDNHERQVARGEFP